MPKYVRVRVKSTGAHIWVASHSVNESVEVLNHQPSRAAGSLLPTPKKNLASPAAPVEVPKSPTSSEQEIAGTTGSKKEGSK